MILATHQPLFLPWPGFFQKAAQSDRMVLLDDVQFPRGRSWLSRNRLKNEQGELWLTVPVWKKGRGFQSIRDVHVYDERSWRRKHLRSIEQNYGNAPYFDDYFPVVQSIYGAGQDALIDLNLGIIGFMWAALSPRADLSLQSELGVSGRGTELIVSLCRETGADRYAMFPAAQKHVDLSMLRDHGIEPHVLKFHPPVYPQLWGDFIYNLSTLDLLLNCGPKSAEIIAEA